ncbi:hypothetical protein, partial [Devosia sp. A369]
HRDVLQPDPQARPQWYALTCRVRATTPNLTPKVSTERGAIQTALLACHLRSPILHRWSDATRGQPLMVDKDA